MEFSSTRSISAEIFASLTASQQEAVCHVDGPLLILAGPGSGKTRVVTYRIAHLLTRGIPPSQMLALTFTNKAADEMQQRLQQLAPGQPVWMGTFHRFCARLLRQHASLIGLAENFSIYDMDDSRKLLTEAIRQADVELIHVTVDQVAREISTAKSNLLTAERYLPRSGHPLGSIVQQIYPVYQRQLLTANAVDFDDLLLHVATMLRDNPELRRILDERYRYILVDEYQDTNFAQYAIVRALSQAHPNLAVTGDPDQSIYGWRGANLSNILEFESDFPEVRVVRLEQNYRSTKSILRVADHLIAYNKRRKPKALFTENSEGQTVRLVTYPSGYDEAENIADQIAASINQGHRRPRDFAIFYRVNSLSRSFESALRNAGVPYQIVRGVEFYQRKEIKDVLAYLHLINNPSNDVALRRVINTPPRKIGRRTIQCLAEHARQHRLCLLDVARQAGLIDSLPKRSAAHVAAFVAMYDRLSLMATAPLEEVVGYVLTETGYLPWLKDSDDADDEERVANVEELLNAAREFDRQHPDDGHLEEYLEQTSLVSDTDDWELETDRVSLMTLHAAKGLEFPAVYVTAIEEGFLPHEWSRENQEQLEEERRLLFVGVTRSREELQLSLAEKRLMRGSARPRISSSFLMELPRDEMEIHGRPSYEPTEVAGQIADFESEPAWSDEEFVQDDVARQVAEAEHFIEEPEVIETPQDAVLPGDGDTEDAALPVRTGAEMLDGTAAAQDKPDRAGRVSPERFQQGMVVRHPEYGLGKIIALSGEGMKRAAVVQFFTLPRSRKIFLAHSDLKPVRASS